MARKAPYRLAGLLGLALTGCLGGPTTLTIASTDIPPTFQLSGSGKTAYFVVRGPFPDGNASHTYEEVKVRKDTTLWAITHQKVNAAVGDISPVKVGVVPENARQTVGPMPPLEVGKQDRKSTRLNSSHIPLSRMPSSA